MTKCLRRNSCKEERSILAHSWMTETILVALEAGWPEGEGKPARAPQNEISYSHLRRCRKDKKQQNGNMGQNRGYSEHRLAICFLPLAPAYQFDSSPKQWGYWGPSVQRLGAFGIM